MNTTFYEFIKLAKKTAGLIIPTPRKRLNLVQSEEGLFKGRVFTTAGFGFVENIRIHSLVNGYGYNFKKRRFLLPSP